MNSDVMGKAMVIAYAQLGVQIDRLENTDSGIVMFFSVPRDAYDKKVYNIENYGKYLAQRVKHTLEEMGTKFAICRYKIRDEYWTKEMSDSAVRSAYKDMGYRDWQIKW